jgi:methylated-DNA-[protein]-cysteine S-methyltransferase
MKTKEIKYDIPEIFKIVVSQLQECFDGKRTEFKFSLHPIGTEFQKKVWQELLHTPCEKTSSHLELSKKISDVKAIRAITTAN